MRLWLDITEILRRPGNVHSAIRKNVFAKTCLSLKYSKADVSPLVSLSTQLVSGNDVRGGLLVADKKYHKISITDNGIGFEQEYAKNIFALFHRLHDDHAYAGTGIGLTICKKIVENHKGIITAEGIPNVGATFNIYLPV